MKERHDELLRQAESDPESLVMPEHLLVTINLFSQTNLFNYQLLIANFVYFSVGYKLIPTWFDFYFSKDNFIADRIEFANEDGVWTNMRIAA